MFFIYFLIALARTFVLTVSFVLLALDLFC